MNGTVEYDGKDIRTIKADITIDVKAINTQNANRDNDLRGTEFFDIAKYPTITFKSKRVEPGRRRVQADRRPDDPQRRPRKSRSTSRRRRR